MAPMFFDTAKSAEAMPGVGKELGAFVPNCMHPGHVIFLGFMLLWDALEVYNPIWWCVIHLDKYINTTVYFSPFDYSAPVCSVASQGTMAYALYHPGSANLVEHADYINFVIVLFVLSLSLLASTIPKRWMGLGDHTSLLSQVATPDFGIAIWMRIAWLGANVTKNDSV